jgi:hypothetical protein
MRACYFKATIVGACASALFSAGPASATPAKDIQAAARVLTFLEKGPTGKVVIGVVFDPHKPVSVAEKDEIMAALGGGFSAGAITLTGQPMEAGGVGGVEVVFITRGVDYAAVGSNAGTRRIISIGSDPACVQSGGCVMGVSTDPTVQITVNRNAAAAAGAAFKAAFLMMVHEIQGVARSQT